MIKKNINRKAKSHKKPYGQKGDSFLLIEDDQPMIERTRQNLENKDFKVWTTYSVEEALYYLEFGLNDSDRIIVFMLKRQ